MLSISAQQYEDFKKGLPQWAPETELDTPRGVMEVDQQRRQAGAQPTTLGAAIEEQYVKPNLFQSVLNSAIESVNPLFQAGNALKGAERLRQGSLGLFTGSNPYESIQQAGQGLAGQQTFDPQNLGFARLMPQGSFAREAAGETLGQVVNPINYVPFGAGVSAGRAAFAAGASGLAGIGAKRAVTGLTGSEAAGETAGIVGNLAGGFAALGAGTRGATRVLETDATSNPTVQKLVDFINVAKPAQREQAGLYSAARSARAGKVADVLTGQTGEAAFRSAKQELGGSLPKVQFAAPRPEFSQEEINSLFDTVRTAPGLRPFDRINVSDALTTALAGQVPTRSEIAGLEKVFGTSLAKALQSRRTMGSKLTELGGELIQAPRTLQASWDASAPLRQGIILGIAHPVSATRAAGAMVRAMWSEAGAEAVDNSIRNAPWAQEAERAGLYRAPLFGDFGRMADREEAFMGNIAERLPLIGRGVRGSERGYVTYLNKLRDDVFGNTISGWDEAYRADVTNTEKLAKFINVATGRGDLGWLENHAPSLNAAFFAPRYFTSRVQVNWQGLKAAADLGKSAALGQAFDPASKQIAGDLAKFYATGITALGLLKASGAADVELDPRSSDFGKVRIGSTRYDFWAGQQQVARFVANLVSGQKKSATTGTVYGVPQKQVLVDFIRSKLAPVPGLVADAYAGQTGTGDTVDLTADSLRTQAWNRLVPFFIHDTIDATHNEGLVGGFKALPSAVGVGYQRFGEERVPLDQKSQELFGTGYNDISPSQQREVQAQLPDVMAKLNADTIKRGGAAGAKLQARQDMLDQLSQIDPNLQGKAFRDKVSEKETEARIRREQTDRVLGKPDVPPGSPEERALSDYYDALTKTVDGSIDWETTDGKRAELEKSWTPTQKAYVDQETGAVDPNLPPRVQELKRTQKGLDSTGFFDLRNKAWADFQAAYPQQLAGVGPDYYKWRDAQVREETQNYIAQGYAPEMAAIGANDKVSQYKAVSAFNEFYRKEYRHQWVVDNPELAARAAAAGYFNPDKQETQFLAEKSRKQ